MPNVSGPSDPSDVNNRKFFVAAPEKDASKGINLQELGNAIHSLEASAADNSKRKDQATLQNIQSTNLAQNTYNAQAVLDIAIKPSTQKGIMDALQKAGFSADQFLSEFNNDSIGSQFKQMANVINKYMGFSPNPKEPNSTYVLANVLFKTLGSPPNAPTYTTYDNTQTTATLRAEVDGTQESGWEQIVGINSYVAFSHNDTTAYNVVSGLTPNPIAVAMKAKSTPMEVCEKSSVGNILLSKPSLFPDPSSLKASGSNPVAFPLSDSLNAQVSQLTNSINSVDSQAKDAITSIANSLEVLNQGGLSTANQNSLANVQALVSELSPEDATPQDLQNIAQALLGALNDSQGQNLF